MMTIHPDRDDPNCKHSRMTCSSCIQLPLNVDGIDAIIDTQILTTPHDLLVQLSALDNGIKQKY